MFERIRSSVEQFAADGCRVLFPPHCAFCHSGLDAAEAMEKAPTLCGACRQRFAPETPNRCRRCGASAPTALPTERCWRCQHVSLQFDTVIPLGSYHHGLRDAIFRMKQPRHDSLSLAMGQLLVERRFRELSDIGATLVVPIPMYWTRRWSRGKNGPELLAACCAKALHIPAERVLSRCRNTPPQRNMPAAKRFANVRGAFAVDHPERVKDARILLVDDVLTTGATCSEAAKMLKEAGAAAVSVAVIARAED